MIKKFETKYNDNDKSVVSLDDIIKIFSKINKYKNIKDFLKLRNIKL